MAHTAGDHTGGDHGSHLGRDPRAGDDPADRGPPSTAEEGHERRRQLDHAEPLERRALCALLPLEPCALEALAKVGAKDVAFRVDPAILGGLVIRVGDKVLDGSVAGKLEGLRQNLR